MLRKRTAALVAAVMSLAFLMDGAAHIPAPVRTPSVPAAPATAVAGGHENPAELTSTALAQTGEEKKVLIEDLGEPLQSAATEVDRIIRQSPDEYVSLAYLGLSLEQEATVECAVVNTYAPESAPEYLFSCSADGTRFVWPGLAREAYTEHQQLEQFARVAAGAIVRPYMDQQQKFVAIHNYVCSYLSYAYVDTMETALSMRLGQCHYYALLTEAICGAAGIPCIYVAGDACTREWGGGGWRYVWGAHAWVQVCIGSTWYYSDPCWDDTGRTSRYLLSQVLWPDHRTYI